MPAPLQLARTVRQAAEQGQMEASIMGKPSGLKPGQVAPRSGQYQTIGPRGGKGAEVTSVKGEPLPPTPAAGSTYKLVDATKHKSGK